MGPGSMSRRPTSMMSNQRRGSCGRRRTPKPPTTTMKAPPPERTGRLTRALSGGMSARTRACHARIRSLVSAGSSTGGQPARASRPALQAIGVPLTRNRRASFGSDPAFIAPHTEHHRQPCGRRNHRTTSNARGRFRCATQCVKPPGHKTSCQSSAVGNGSSAPTIEFLEDLRSRAIRHLARRWAHTDADNMTDQGNEDERGIHDGRRRTRRAERLDALFRAFDRLTRMNSPIGCRLAPDEERNRCWMRLTSCGANGARRPCWRAPRRGAQAVLTRYSEGSYRPTFVGSTGVSQGPSDPGGDRRDARRCRRCPAVADALDPEIVEALALDPHRSPTSPRGMCRMVRSRRAPGAWRS